MNEPTDGDVTGNPATPRKWRRSGKCANGACVEVATGTPDVGVFIRDGKLGADSPVLPLSRTAFRDFIDTVKRR